MRNSEDRYCAHAFWREKERADKKYGSFVSTHEAYGVLAEESKELLDAIHGNNVVAIRNEAIQVAAVAMRLAEACHEEHSRSDGTERGAFGIRSGL